jgi:predicted dithiol-disulfide oxidoreductase (DUF899 family)
MINHNIVSKQEWIAARKQFLQKEKEFTQLREELSRQRRELPWERVDKNYLFETDTGQQSLADLFGKRDQLVVYHFMFAPEWETGCRSCSFWADNFNGIVPHLNQRDVSFIAISRAPLDKLKSFGARMGWNFNWASAGSNDFNYDYQVSFTPEEIAAGEVAYNYTREPVGMNEKPGISVFYKSEEGTVFHTYSTFARGLDMMNTAYHYLDLVPKGRDEAALSFPMAWVKLHDLYT